MASAEEEDQRGKDAPAANGVQPLQHGPGNGGPCPHLCALAQLIHQHQRVLCYIIHHIPAPPNNNSIGAPVNSLLDSLQHKIYQR